MDPSLVPLFQCFEQTLSPEHEIRKHAESELREVEKTPGFVCALLTIISTSEQDSVKQAGAVYLKNCVNRRWSLTSDSDQSISEIEKSEFRGRLVPIIVTSSLTSRTQLANVLNQVLGIDFPQEWPDFLESTVALLQSHDLSSVYAGLLCLLELSRIFRWRSKDRRKGLDSVIAATFGTILQIAESLVLEDHELAGDMLRLILKIYKCVIWLELPLELQKMSSLVPWGQLLLKIVTKQVSNKSPDQQEFGDKSVWLKAKKWAYFCLDRLFQRYGDPTQLGGEAAKDYFAFAKMFSSTFAPEILRCYLSQVQNWAADRNIHYLSPRALYFIGSFLCSSVKPKPTWAVLKDNVDSLVEHFVYPQICQTPDDLELWDSDPQEYINKRIDVYDDYSSPDVAAINFLVACCSRKKSICFQHTLEFVNRELVLQEEATDAARDPIKKEGALRLIGTLSHLILEGNSSVKPLMEQFFVAHVFPEFKSPHGFLRARACEMMNRFAEIEFQNQKNLFTAYEGIMNCLTERELPVRVEAALALQPLIRQDLVHKEMIASIPQIMNVLLQLANEVDVDSLSNVMEEFVEVFANELTPYAVELTEQLRDTFLRIMQDTTEASGDVAEEGFDWDNTDDKSLVALGVLNTIGTLILSLENTLEALSRLEETVLPVINLVLRNEVVDLYAEVFEIIDSCTFSAKSISPTMWGVFQTLYGTFKLSGIDYIDEVLPCLDNYLTFGQDVLAVNHEYQAMLFDIIQSVFSNDRLGVQDRLAVTKLAQTFLLNLRGHIDHYLQPIMDIVMNHLSDPKEPKIGSYRLLLIETLVGAIYYNPAAALRILENNGGTTEFLNLWLSSLGQLTRVHDKKLVILTIISLLALPSGAVPESVRPGWTHLSSAMLEVFKSYPAAIARRELAQTKLTSEDSDYWKNDVHGINGNENDEDEDDWDENDAGDSTGDFGLKDSGDEYLDFLGAEATRLQKQTSPSDDDGYDDDEMSEDALFVSPIEKVDPYMVAKAYFHDIHESNPALYEQILAGWTEDQQNEFRSVMMTAATNESILVAKEANA